MRIQITISEIAVNRGLGLERTDNNMKSHTWPIIHMINQKNYYTSVTRGSLVLGPRLKVISTENT